MKLEGTLDAFSLPDIFQLLSFTRKTGGLHLRTSSAEGVIWFTDGTVTGASSDTTRQSLARRIVATTDIEEDALVSAVEMAVEHPATGVTRALIDAGVLTAEAIAGPARELTVDAVFDLLRRPEGSFSFEVDESNADDVGVVLSVEELVVETTKRGEGWDAVASIIPSPTAVLAMPVVPPADTTLNRDEWSLLALTDGRRSVADVVELAGTGQYTAVTNLAALVARGLLEVREASGDDLLGLQRRLAMLAPLETAAFDPVTTVRIVPAGDNRTDVVPARDEPFLPRRKPAYIDGVDTADDDEGNVVSLPTQRIGDNGEELPDHMGMLERDAGVDRSLMLRLIAGVRGL